MPKLQYIIIDSFRYNVYSCTKVTDNVVELMGPDHDGYDGAPRIAFLVGQGFILPSPTAPFLVESWFRYLDELHGF